MAQITLLDGSIGQELVKRSGDRPTPLWSTQVMLDHPGLVAEVHRNYARSGATVASVNSYALHRDRLVMADVDPALLPNLVNAALNEAEAGCDGARIAGALGPINASYRPDLCPSVDEAAEIYGELVQMMKGRVDLFLIETVVSVKHAEGAMAGCRAAGCPVWLSISVDDQDGTRLRSGEAVAALGEILSRYKPDAILVNCSRPEAVGAALDILKTFGLPFGAYANGFTHISDGFLQAKPTVDALEARHDLDPLAYARFAMEWVAQGATIIGGCCEVGPAHIAQIASDLRKARHDIV